MNGKDAMTAKDDPDIYIGTLGNVTQFRLKNLCVFKAYLVKMALNVTINPILAVKPYLHVE